MLALHLATALVALAVLGTSVAVSPPRRRGLEGVAARRGRQLAAEPDRVTSLDVLEALVREGMPRAQARLVTERAAANHLHPRTLWQWLRRFDAGALGIVVAADLSHEQLLDHVTRGTVPDLDELAVFAAFNGLEVDRAARRPAPGRRVLVDSVAKEQSRELARRLAEERQARLLPPIHEPGTWPEHATPGVATPEHDTEQRAGGRSENCGGDHLAA